MIHVFQDVQRLKMFVEINYVGFGKILKKYDKATGEKVRKGFMERLDSEEFFKSDEVGRLIQHAETVFFVVSDGKQLADVRLHTIRHKQVSQSADTSAYRIISPFVCWCCICVFGTDCRHHGRTKQSRQDRIHHEAESIGIRFGLVSGTVAVTHHGRGQRARPSLHWYVWTAVKHVMLREPQHA